MKRPVIAVWFSCGAASAVAAFETIRLYGHVCEIRIINNIIAEKDIDNRRFLRDCERWLGQEIEIAVNPQYPHCSAVGIWDQRNYMAGPDGAPCTHHLKKLARSHWENNNHHDFLVMGFTAEEKARSERFIKTERSNVIPVLINGGYTKQHTIDFIRAAGIELPRAYRLGYPNANCYGCVKATSPTYWNHVRTVHPAIFAHRAAQSRRIGKKLVRVNNERIYLDELSPDAKGRPMKELIMPDCSIFCEEFSKGTA